MNLLQKQGFFNSIILYTGNALGFFNLIILFQRFLTAEEIGFFQLMVAISILYAQIASLGLNGVILKYFPYYRSEDKKHEGFIKFVILWTGLAFTVFTLLFLLFKAPILNYYKDDKGVALLTKNYYYLIPISFFTLVFTVLESMARLIYRNVYSAFLKEVLLRAFTSLSIILVAYTIIDYHYFLQIYLAASALIALLLWYNLYKAKYFFWAPVQNTILEKKNELINYGLFAVLGGGSFNLVQNMGIFMLTQVTKSLDSVGIYGTFAGIAVVISMPSRALSRTSYQIVAEAWVNHDLPKINKIYYKTSVVQSLIGSLLLIGLIVNQQNLVSLLHKPEYAQHFNVLIVIGLAFLVDVTGGLNGQIINLSKYYKFTTYLVAVSVILCAMLSFLLIPVFGMLGAALAYFITMLSLNFVYWLFIKIKFGLQPFNKAHLFIILISIFSLIIGLFIPEMNNIYIDIFIRSAVVSTVYILLAYWFDISEDISSLINKVLNR